MEGEVNDGGSYSGGVPPAPARHAGLPAPVIASTRPQTTAQESLSPDTLAAASSSPSPAERVPVAHNPLLDERGLVRA